MGSSQTRARTRVPCIGRRILNHCATREAPELLTYKRQRENLPYIVLNKIIKEDCVWTVAMGLKFCLSATIKGTDIPPLCPPNPTRRPREIITAKGQTLKEVIESQLQAEVLG